VKSLEKVQGDERDTIVISCTYGPSEPGGPVAMRFGPINQQGGHRRLNVLFTRAKRAIELVTSIESHQIHPTATSSQGIHAFRNYLKFVESQSLETGRPSGREPDSPFEVVVAEAIQRHGYEVDCQVGVANYFIDLAIRHPNKPDTYLLGVECDGATYHSARAARDRDKYRQAVLEGLGWQIYRIWSTDWFENHTKEIKSLIKKLKQIEAVANEETCEAKKLDQEKKQAKQTVEDHKIKSKPTTAKQYGSEQSETRTSKSSTEKAIGNILRPQMPEEKEQTEVSTNSHRVDHSVHGSNPRLEGFLSIANDKGFAVLDLETTGFGKSAKILEIAVVRLGRHGEFVDHWETLIQPEMLIKNSFVHGITDAMVRDAPTFEEIAHELCELLHGHVLVAHNLNSFDKPILSAHFQAVRNLSIDLGLGLDTMPSPKRKLSKLCEDYGVILLEEQAHTALGDTRALAEVFRKGLDYLSKQTRAVQAISAAPPRATPTARKSRSNL
jgi:DNA polymerase III epsilon subunit family exonuclease